MKVLCLVLVAMSLSQAPAFAASSEAINQVGVSWMKALAAEKVSKEENILFSPISAETALAMAFNGTAGNTRDRFGALLFNERSVSSQVVNKVNTFQKSLAATMMQKAVKPKQDGDVTPVVLQSVNGAWTTTSQPYKFDAKYQSLLQKIYGAKTTRLDFLNEKSADVLNKWAFDNTNGLVPKIIDAGTLSELIWVLMNATYFEGSWQRGFRNVDAANAKPFVSASGKKIAATMIRASSDYQYWKDSQKEVIELPFFNDGSNNAFSFLLLLPNEKVNFAQWQQNEVWTSTKYWNEILSQTASAPVTHGSIMMPKFSFSHSVTLKQKSPMTSVLGLDFLFDDNANFSTMDAKGSGPSKVGIIKQDSRIELDEKGVKAAAVTMIGGVGRSAVVEKNEFNMLVNRPFTFAIVEKKTGTLLFLGSVSDPTKSE
jgi:serine protease inhibitor